MITTREVLKALLGILAAIGALCLGWVFWVYFMLSFGTVVSLWVTPVMLIYIYITVGLARLKKWAWGMFLTIGVLTILIWILVIVIIGSELSREAAIDWLFAIFTWVSLVAIPVFSISALIRMITRKLKER